MPNCRISLIVIPLNNNSLSSVSGGYVVNSMRFEAFVTRIILTNYFTLCGRSNEFK